MSLFQSVWGNVFLFQIAWFSGVLGAAHHQSGWGTILIVVCVLIHVLGAPKDSRLTELWLIGRCLLLGIVVETLFVQAQIMAYAETGPWDWMCPLWLAGLWAAFAMTLNHSLKWLKNHVVGAAILGALLGPMSYWAGARLGAGEIPDPLMSTFVISLAWFVALPLMMRWSQREISW